VGDEDDLFCQVALRLGFLTEVEVALALEIQGGLSNPQRIGKIFVSRGLLTPTQVEKVLAAQALERGTAPEPEAAELLRAAAEAQIFGKLAVLRGLATEGEVEECIWSQRQLAEKGEAIPLGEVLVRKGYLRPEDVKGLLALQAHAASVAKRSPRDPELPGEPPSTSPALRDEHDSA